MTQKEIAAEIKKDYGMRSKSALMRKYGLSSFQFDKILRENGISWQDPAKRSVRSKEIDYSKLNATKVEGLPGNAVVYSRRFKDPVEIKNKYLNRKP